MGYDPALSQAARSLAAARHGRRSRNALVAVSLPLDQLDRPYYADLLRGAARALVAGGAAAVLTDFYRVMYRQLSPGEQIGVALHRGLVDAMVVHPFNIAVVEALLARLRQARFGDRPVVTLVRRVAGLPCVSSDLRTGWRGQAQALAALGHRQVLALRWSGFETASESPHVDAMRQILGPTAVVEHEVPLAWMDPNRAPHSTAALEGGIDVPGAAELVAQLRLHPAITAVVAPNDATGLHAVQALRRAGISIPGRISVVGCDGTDDIADGTDHRFLASIRVPLTEIGAAAARLALALADGPADEPPALATTLLPGRSLGSADPAAGGHG
jgi:LacI family transcriptional regulator